MDLLSLPMSERLNLDGKKKAEYVRTLHEKVRANIEKKIQQYTRQAKEGKKKVTFEPGDWVWLHLRKDGSQRRGVPNSYQGTMDHSKC
ncbi:hypothetical protein F511_25576 [Dorcoceras hygrometricum]|uniref:Uncharacterized protein n=1 Tax=Dorcoceras hygrometricum TaxID=472368 RepID=A0A2Z7C481_9LAMI|nr:hypothetical protein F511_25576 [Dorcoceras hygrometricum]